VETPATGEYFQMTPQGVLGAITLFKSANHLHYRREVLKLSEVLSYIGGLMGFLISFLFIINSYATFSLEMNLSADLFA